MQEIKEIGLVIHDLVDGEAAHIDDYLDLYVDLFPEYTRYIPLMRRRAEIPADMSVNEKWHQWLMMIKGRPVGLVGFLYNRARNVGILMDFAIQPEARRIEYIDGRKLASFVLQLAMQQLVVDAQSNGKNMPLFMIAEVEHEALLKRYMEYGYLKFPVEYYEPPYPSELMGIADKTQNLDKMDYKRMYLGAFKLPGQPFNPNDRGVITTAILTMLVDHYGLPASHWLTEKMLVAIPE
jgi:hypothetical protein